MSLHPHFGHTKSGLPVHARTADHHHGGAFNKKVAVGITTAVGSMWCAYVFAVLALASLPAILTQAFHLTVFPKWLISASLITLVAWVSSYFLQLVLLPIIIVGQNVQSEAADARAAKTFEDVAVVLDRTDLDTTGGLTAVYQEILKAREDFHQVLSALNAMHAPQPPGSAGTGRKPGTPKTSSSAKKG
jgi:hypothetical protein